LLWVCIWMLHKRLSPEGFPIESGSVFFLHISVFRHFSGQLHCMDPPAASLASWFMKHISPLRFCCSNIKKCNTLHFTFTFMHLRFYPKRLFLHILLFCTFFISLHILLLFLLFLPYVCPCVMLLYIICILIILHCPLSGPDSITFHL